MRQLFKDEIDRIRRSEGVGIFLETPAVKNLWADAERIAADSPDEALEVMRFVAPMMEHMGNFGDQNLALAYSLGADLEWRLMSRVDPLISPRAGECRVSIHDDGLAGIYFEHAAELMTKGCAGHNEVWMMSGYYYKKARLSYEAAGNSGKASECHIKGMKLTRDNHPSRRVRASYWALYLLWKWGESPWHVAVSGAALVCLYALGFWAFGIKPSGTRIENLGNSLYLSTISFTTVGFGDFSPDSPLSKILAASEGVMGILFTGLFLVTFVKRFGR